MSDSGRRDGESRMRQESESRDKRKSGRRGEGEKKETD